MIAFANLPVEIILIICESFDHVGDIYRFARICRPVYRYLQTNNRLSEIIKRVLWRSPRLKTELWLNLFIDLNHQQNNTVNASLKGTQLCQKLGPKLLTIYINDMPSAKTKYPLTSVEVMSDDTEMALACVYQLDDDALWTILSRRQNMALLYDLYKGCLPEYSESLFPWRAWANRDDEDEMWIEEEAAAAFVTQAEVPFKPDLTKSRLSRDNEEESLFVAALLELWLRIEICEWITSESCEYVDQAAQQSVLKDIIRWPSFKISCDSIVDSLHQMEVYDFVYTFLLGRAAYSSLHETIAKWNTDDPDSEFAAPSWAMAVQAWKLAHDGGPLDVSPPTILEIVASRLAGKSAWIENDIGTEIMARLSNRNALCLAREGFLDHVFHPLKRKMFERCFSLQVESLALHNPDLGLSIHLAGHFRVRWQLLAQGTVFQWGRCQGNALNRLKRSSEELDDSEANIYFSPGQPICSDQALIALQAKLQSLIETDQLWTAFRISAATQ